MTEQEKLIGKHPSPPDVFAAWLDHEDLPTTPSKKHRKLSENSGERQKAIEQIAQWIIEHHLDERKIVRLKKRKIEIMQKYALTDYAEYLEKQLPFPTVHNTQTGNATEIILSHYLQSSSGLKLLAYKLTYNGNVEQALKGDDCLLFNRVNLFDFVILGEAKYRATPQPEAIRGIVANLESSKRLPISIPFIAQHFTTQGDDEMAGKLEDLIYEINIGKVNIINVGLLLSTQSDTHTGKDAASQVEAYLNTTNENLVFLSLGVDNPLEIIEDAFEKAKQELIKRLQ